MAVSLNPGEVVLTKAETRLEGQIGTVHLTGQRLIWIPDDRGASQKEVSPKLNFWSVVHTPVDGLEVTFHSCQVRGCKTGQLNFLIFCRLTAFLDHFELLRLRFQRASVGLHFPVGPQGAQLDTRSPFAASGMYCACSKLIFSSGHLPDVTAAATK
jgi:hypothetical protein